MMSDHPKVGEYWILEKDIHYFSKSGAKVYGMAGKIISIQNQVTDDTGRWRGGDLTMAYDSEQYTWFYGEMNKHRWRQARKFTCGFCQSPYYSLDDYLCENCAKSN
jgi:hypothetical protein